MVRRTATMDSTVDARSWLTKCSASDPMAPNILGVHRISLLSSRNVQYRRWLSLSQQDLRHSSASAEYL